jgi:predicted dehydrogenase
MAARHHPDGVALRRQQAELQVELAAFLDACRGRIDVPVTAGDGVRAMLIVEAAARAARTGQTVSLG